MTFTLSTEQREQVAMTRREFAAVLENFDALKADRDKLVALRDESRRVAAELLEDGSPEKDADVTRLLLLERRETWAETRLEFSQLALNSSGEQVRDFLLSTVKPTMERVLSPVLASAIEENVAKLTPIVGEHQAHAAAADTEAARRLRNFLTLTFIRPTTDQGHAALPWLDALLQGELPREAK